MPRRACRCVVNLTLNEVTAPGVWLPSREDVYLSVSLFGQYQTTRRLVSVFPLAVYEAFRFEKTYYTALDTEEVADCLNDELVIFELVQLSEYTDGAVRLASFSSIVGEFLQHSRTSSDYEVLLSRTIAFNGISPRLSFSTRLSIKESLSPELDALEDALEEEEERRIFLKTHRVPTRRIRSAKNRSASTHNLTILSYNPDEDDPAPRYRQPTKSSLSHRRSASGPGSVVDIDLISTGLERRPTFVVRRVDKELARDGHCDRNTNASRKDKNLDGSRPRSKKEKKEKRPKSSKSRDGLDLEHSSYGHHSHVYKAYERQPIHLHLSDDEDSGIYITRQRPRSAAGAYVGYQPRMRYSMPPVRPSYYSRTEPVRVVPCYDSGIGDLYL
ncbi:hypothetical protein ACOMHN_057330 [Nucella lapillus]